MALAGGAARGVGNAGPPVRRQTGRRGLVVVTVTLTKPVLVG